MFVLDSPGPGNGRREPSAESMARSLLADSGQPGDSQWADASAACLVEALARYAQSTDVPLSDLGSDNGSFCLGGGS